MKQSQKTIYDLIVIGGGASGMMAAVVAAEHGKRVLILEKNRELGAKLKITGGGRCNITNATFDTPKLLKKYGKVDKFLFSPFSQFGVQDTFDYFESRNLPLVTEARDRVFPKSQRAFDVYKVLEKEIKKRKVEVLLNTVVAKIFAEPETRKVVSVKTTSGTFYAHNFLIATGGVSHPETGSTGDGFSWLKKMGHTVDEPTPSIVPLRVKEKWVKELSGVSLSFMKITFFIEGKKAFSEKGKVLFTHFGLSSPLILNLAHKVADLLHEGQVTALIDCYPDTDLGSLEKTILKAFDHNKNKAFKNVVKEIVPKGLSQTILDFKVIKNPDEKIHSISKEERKALVHLLKGLPLTIEGLMGMDRAVISDGGVPLSEVDTKTMKSKLYDNLYLTGDILHVNRPSGGYSLQLCWTTGYVAGLLG